MPPNEDLEQLKLRLDYAWKWFSFHADQRIKMFNYMLIVFGIFATAVVGAVTGGLPRLAFWLCLVFSALAFVFALLDRRNRDLLWFGEDVLRELERKHLFGEHQQISNGKGEEVTFGILWRQTQSENIWLSRHDYIAWLRDAWLGKHRVWLRLIALAIGVLFLIGAIVTWSNEQEIAKLKPSSSAPVKSEAVKPPILGKESRKSSSQTHYPQR